MPNLLIRKNQSLIKKLSFFGSMKIKSFQPPEAPIANMTSLQTIYCQLATPKIGMVFGWEATLKLSIPNMTICRFAPHSTLTCTFQ
jgi:hypothetical protein